MSKKENSLSLVLRLVDKATGPLKAFGHYLKGLNEPGRRLGKALSEIGEQSGLFKIGEALKGVGEGFHRVGEKALEFGKELAVMALEAGFVGYEVISRFVEMGDQVKKTSERLGLSVDGFSELQFVAKRSGMSVEEITINLDKFNKGLGEAKVGTGSLLKALGHTPAAFRKQVLGAKNNEEALDLMFAAMAKIEDPSRKAAFATEFFGKSGAKMVNMVKGGPEEIKKLRAEYRRLAGSQQKFAESAEILSDAMDDVKAAFFGVGSAIVTELFPSLTELSGVVKEFLVDNREGVRVWAQDAAKAITDWVRGGGIQSLVERFREFADAAKPIVDFFGGWPQTIAVVAAAITTGPLLGALAGLAGALLSLGEATLTTPLGWFAAAGAAGLLLVKNWGPVSDFFGKFFPSLTAQLKDAAAGFEWLAAKSSAAVTSAAEWEAQQEKSAADSGWAKSINDWGNSLFAGPKASEVAGARPGATQKAHVIVDLNNAPRGTKTTIAPGSTASVDLNTGISMAAH